MNIANVIHFTAIQSHNCLILITRIQFVTERKREREYRCIVYGIRTNAKYSTDLCKGDLLFGNEFLVYVCVL